MKPNVQHLESRDSVDPASVKIIACATVVEEMAPLLSSEVSCETLDFGLHINPDELKKSLQHAIDATSEKISHIILGYGLCSQAVTGLKTDRFTLVVPRVDDCISIFIGSTAERNLQHAAVPGTYYVTKGWLKVGSTPFDEFEDMVKKYGRDKAAKIMGQILKNYTRLAFINTGSDMDDYHRRAREIAEKFHLRYEEIPGSDRLVRKMLFGPWDDEMLIVPPGREISFLDFRER